MALPKLQTSEHTLTLPSTQEEIKFRPFLVKEQKILMIAQESGEDFQIASAMGQLVSGCTFGSVDANLSPMFDIEYVFLKIRMKAAGSKIEVKLLCPDDKVTYAEAEIDLEEVEVFFPEGHENNIKLTDDVGLVLDYPTIEMTDDLLGVGADTAWTIIKRCIRQIYDADNVHNRADMDENELEEFVSTLDAQMFAKIENFFNTVPRLKHTVKVTNPVTKVESDVVVEGLQSFFG